MVQDKDALPSMGGEIPNPPNAEVFTAVLAATSRALQRVGLPDLVMDGPTTDLVREMADLLGRIQRAAEGAPVKEQPHQAKQWMDCGSCGCGVEFTIVREPDDGPHRQAVDPSFYYYCPVCSSAEPVEGQ